MIDKKTLDAVLPVPSLEELRDAKVEELKNEGFVITNFHSGGVFHTMLMIALRSTAVYGQDMAFPNPFQIREVGDHRGLLAAERQVDEVLDAGQVQFEGHGFKLGVLTIGKAVQPFGQIIQFIHIDALGIQPVEDGVRAFQPHHPAVLGGRGANANVLQHTDDEVIIAVRDGEGDRDLPVSWAGLAAEDCFENHSEKLLPKFLCDGVADK